MKFRITGKLYDLVTAVEMSVDEMGHDVFQFTRRQSFVDAIARYETAEVPEVFGEKTRHVYYLNLLYRYVKGFDSPVSSEVSGIQTTITFIRDK